MVVLVAKKNSVEKKGSFLFGLMCWRLLVILRGGQHLSVLTGLLFLQVVVGIDASGCHTRIECIDVNVVFVAVTEALHSVGTTESVFSLEEWRDVLRYESGKLLKWPSGRGFCRRSSGVPS